jgi:hypothetical protein
MTTEDFNPFDLSAPPKPLKDDQPPAPKPAKATVRRVGIGPLLHSSFTRFLVFVGVLFICAAAGYSAELWWLTRTK